MTAGVEPAQWNPGRWLRTLSRPVALAAGAGVLLLIGSLLPWVSGDGPLSFGWAQHATGRMALGSRAGLAGGDAVVTLLVGAAALLVAAHRVWRGPLRGHRTVLIGAGALAACWAVLNMAEAGRTPTPTGESLDLSPSVGLYLVLLGALLAIGAGALSRPDPVAELTLATERAVRLWESGHEVPGLARLQHAVRTWESGVGTAHPAFSVALALLGRMYLQIGAPDRAVAAVEMAWTQTANWPQPDPHALSIVQSLQHDVRSLAHG
ncbi:hypothetical protein [Streptomyces sp. NBC_00690]|uniref:hypothetical protein n=1 Tax=Streptomyces sp. NBC_00690 TaxID=2975808 RepID=UPI002E2E2C5B|nr:hypothetical protein [Streptomyces sp. NBC_00690]